MGEVAVLFHELSFVPEGGEMTVGRADSGSYAVLPADGAALLRELVQGMPPEHAAQWYESTFGEQVDIGDFLETLRELGFVRANSEMVAGPPAGIALQWLGRALFSPFAWLCYTVLIAVWLFAVVHDNDLWPRPRYVFFTHSLLVVQLSMIVGQLPLVFLHEAFHTLAGRRLGLRSRLGISNRYMYIVFETQMNGLLSVERRKRYLPFLAGMVCDVVELSLLGLLANATRDANGSFSLTGRIALALAFTVVIRLAWQFQLYLRTDLYYVFSTALSCHDLHDASTTLLRNRIWRLLRRPHRVVDEQQWTERDREVGRWYGPFLVLGVVALLLITALGSLPLLVQYVGTAVRHMSDGPLDGSFWDGALPLLNSVVWLLVPVYLARRKRRQARSRQFPATIKEVN